MHGAGKPASLGTLPPRKQSLRKLLSICKIACVPTLNADTPQTVIVPAPGIHIEVSTRLTLICSFPFLSCEKDATVSSTARNRTSGCLPWLSSRKLEGYTVNTYPYRLLRFQYDKDLCRIKLAVFKICGHRSSFNVRVSTV